MAQDESNLSIFGDFMPALVSQINANASSFRKKPVGPLGKGPASVASFPNFIKFSSAALILKVCGMYPCWLLHCRKKKKNCRLCVV